MEIPHMNHELTQRVKNYRIDAYKDILDGITPKYDFYDRKITDPGYYDKCAAIAYHVKEIDIVDNTKDLLAIMAVYLGYNEKGLLSLLKGFGKELDTYLLNNI
jgi:hypothetical protein